MDDNVRGSLLGLYIGDALAMPVHWYYDRRALSEEYGWVSTFLAPKSPHSGSILWRSKYTPLNAKGEILHEQARYWGQHGVHYHQFLQAGENTLNLQLCQLAWDVCQGGYSLERYTQRYLDFMLTPGKHRDTYIEECHRGFFTNYARGVAPSKCAVEEKHIGGLCHLFPVYLATRDRQAALEHMALTHAGGKMKEVGKQVLDVLQACLDKQDPVEVVRPLLGRERMGWLTHPDEAIIGPRLSTACYVDDAWPAVLYLLAKYANEPRKALEANTSLGGDNCYRGAVLGGLLGAYHGTLAWPSEWLDGLCYQLK